MMMMMMMMIMTMMTLITCQMKSSRGGMPPPFPTNKGEPKISLAMQYNLKLIKTIQTNDTYNEPCLKCTRFSLF